MCDCACVVEQGGPVWFAKNSDREPHEAQFLEYHETADPASRPSDLPSVERPVPALISRPAWMWGAEMGVNANGVAIGNEAVFTRLPVARAGVTGMDFVRSTLHAVRTADDAVECLAELTERFDQGGRMGHRHKGFRYHSSFLVADANTGWVFETAGNFWAAKRVRGTRTISNGLTIGADYDRIHERAADYARGRGWCRPGEMFDFARAFAKPGFRTLTGSEVRRACTHRSLAYLDAWRPDDFARALGDHGNESPGRSWRSVAPCAHASWLPTRAAGQTTGSLIARFGAGGMKIWATGTSSPCLSVFKPTSLDAELFPKRPVEEAYENSEELWWRHDRLLRLCMTDYQERRLLFAAERARFQNECFVASEAAAPELWGRHQELVGRWTEQVRAAAETR